MYLNQQIYHPGAIVTLHLIVQKSTSIINMNGKATFFFIFGGCHQTQTVIQLLRVESMTYTFMFLIFYTI